MQNNAQSVGQNCASLSHTHQKINAPHPLNRVAVMVKTFLRDGYMVRAVEGIKAAECLRQRLWWLMMGTRPNGRR
jgi:hypothetical protein